METTRTVFWDYGAGTVRMIDQRLLPWEVRPLPPSRTIVTLPGPFARCTCAARRLSVPPQPLEWRWPRGRALPAIDWRCCASSSRPVRC